MNNRLSSKEVLLVLLIVFFTVTPIRLYSQVPGNGKITDAVKCISHPDQSYSLYLPQEYDDTKKWPVILIFDPSARGNIGVEVFRSAGQRYGYILACSNNSRNGPIGNNFNAASAMLADLEKRFNIDPGRIYAAGFSGGSRFAMALASAKNTISGVIGCGAGLPNDKNLYPGKQSKFDYYGLAGNLDMNYIEMYELISFLDKNTSVTCFIRTFDGKHEWPEPLLIEEAVCWLTFRAIKRNVFRSDMKLLTESEDRTRSLINSTVSAGNLTDADMYLRFASRDYSGTSWGSEVYGKLAALEQSKEYRDAKREWNRTVVNEQNKKEKYLSKLSDALYAGSLPDSITAWWKNETESLKRLHDRGKKPDSQMSARLLNFITILCFEQGNSCYRLSNYQAASSWFEICTLSDSENPNTWYNFSRSLAGLDRKKESIESLDKAIQHGYNNRKAVESDQVFSNIRNDSRFKILLIKMK